MSGQNTVAGSSLTLRQACDELSRRLRCGQASTAEQFLAAEPATNWTTDAVLELIYTEFVVREELGEQLRPEDWLDRFPQWRVELAQVFEVHALVNNEQTLQTGLSDTHRDDENAGDLDAACDRDRFLGGYEILQEIGRGGMGVVYQARQRALDRIVALKMILPPHGKRERARFRTEAEATARLSHPNIVPIYEVGQEGDQPFLSMEFIPGKSLDKRLADSLMPPRAAAELVLTLARAVAYAHEQGIVHRDLKPANIVLAADGSPKITDFGLARQLVLEGANEGQLENLPSVAIVGTPSYMAPEQCQPGQGVSPAADVYSLGAILYEALTGRPPFRGQTALDILELVRSQEPVPPRSLVPKVLRDLETICLKCLAKQPQQRYGSAAALAEDLRRFLAGEPILARPVGRTEQAIRWCQRNPMIAALSSGIALALLCGSILSTSLAVWAVDAKNQAAAQALRAEQIAEQARTSAQREQVARELAEYRFAQAEKAVEQYLDGIESNEHLKQADFLDLRKHLLTSAVPFYEEFVLQKPGNALLEAKRGRAYGRLGFLRMQIGEHVQAAKDFERMQVIFERLGTADADDRHELAKSHFGLANVLQHQGHHREAHIEYDKCLDLYRMLAAEFPDNASYRKQLAIGQRNLGLILRDLGMREEGEMELRGALVIATDLAKAFPAVAAYRADVAGISTFLASFLTKGHEEEAEALHRQAVALFQQLTEEVPNRSQHRLGLATVRTNYGAFLAGHGKREQALIEYQTALTLRKQLAAEFPAIPAYRQHLALGHRNLGNALLASGKPPDAEVELRTAHALLEQLVADFGGSPDYRFDLARSHDDLGNLMGDVDQSEDVENAHRQALAIRTQLATEFPAVPDYRRYAARSHYELGAWLANHRRYAEAQSEYIQCVDLRKKLLAEFPKDLEMLRWLAIAQGELGLLFERLKRPGDALVVYREALDSRMQLLEAFPDEPAYQNGAAKTLAALAACVRKEGQIDECRRLYARATEHQLKAHQSDPTNGTYAAELRDHYHRLGDVALFQKDHGAAADAANHLARARAEVADDALLAARFFGRCLQLVEQEAGLSEADRETLKHTYSEQGMEHIREAVRRGHTSTAYLQSQPSLAPFRNRADYQQLVQKLESR